MGKQLQKFCPNFLPKSVATLWRGPGGYQERERLQHSAIQMKEENATSFNYLPFRFATLY